MICIRMSLYSFLEVSAHTIRSCQAYSARTQSFCDCIVCFCVCVCMLICACNGTHRSVDSYRMAPRSYIKPRATTVVQLIFNSAVKRFSCANVVNIRGSAFLHIPSVFYFVFVCACKYSSVPFVHHLLVMMLSKMGIAVIGICVLLIAATNVASAADYMETKGKQWQGLFPIRLLIPCMTFMHVSLYRLLKSNECSSTLLRLCNWTILHARAQFIFIWVFVNRMRKSHTRFVICSTAAALRNGS